MNIAEYPREAIIAGNPLLDYAAKQGWKIKRVGPNFVCCCPLHDETTPSFTFNPGKNLWRCFGCGAGGSVIDLHAELRGLTIGEAMRELSAAGGANGSSSNRENHRARQAQPEAEQRARIRANWPAFDEPLEDEIKAIAELRGLSPEAVVLAAERGLVYSAESREGRCWIVTDSRRVNAQARRMDGKPWERFGMTKAWTLPGSIASWPVGLREAAEFPAIALVEGAPDMLAAFHLALCAGMQDCIAPVAVLGAGNSLPQNAMQHFAGKRVRIFVHDDNAGGTAGKKWGPCLSRAGVEVDGFSFSGLTRFDGVPVNDLNDFACIDPDEWEAQRDIVEEAFAFAPEAAQRASA